MAVGGMFMGLLNAAEAVFESEIEAGHLTGDASKLSRILVGLCQSVGWQDFFDGTTPMSTHEFVGIVLDGCRVPNTPT